MLEFLPEEIRDGLNAARARALKRKTRLRVLVGEIEFPLLRFWHDGFAVEASLTTHLRGLVDVYDGSRHIFQCLIIASTAEYGELICEFKRSTAVQDQAALDYWRDDSKPVAYLTSS